MGFGLALKFLLEVILWACYNCAIFETVIKAKRYTVIKTEGL